MNTKTSHQRPSPKSKPSFGESRLNAYEIENASDLSWPVRIYEALPTNGGGLSHSDRGDVKGLFFGLRRKFASRCAGYGFIVDISKTRIVVPEAWNIPDCEEDGFNIRLVKQTTAKASNRDDRKIVAGILREAIKSKFKIDFSDVFGPTWQDFNGFCESPSPHDHSDFIFCRKFEPSVYFLRQDRLVVQILVRTVSLDHRSLSSYFQSGEVKKLARLIELKRANKLTRDNKPASVRVLCDNDEARGSDFLALELSDPDLILSQSGLSKVEQQALASVPVECDVYKRGRRSFEKAAVRLILDPQITNEKHDKTIMLPDDRDLLHGDVADFLDHVDAFGQTAKLAEKCVSCNSFDAFIVRPPALRVADKERGEIILAPPPVVDGETLRARARERSNRVRQHGFLQSRPMKPVVAAPHAFGRERAARLARDMNYLQQRMSAGVHFKHLVYKSVDDLADQIHAGDFDAALIVLPESSRASHQSNDTHELVKQAIDIPSQCIHHDNALPDRWTNSKPGEFSSADPRLANRVRQRYELCLSNLLVKHQWIPFAPADRFHYNVHVGIDVGGRHNNRAMFCVGYGFSEPSSDIIFLPEEINADTQKLEPIPAEFLQASLVRSFSSLRKRIVEFNGSANFDRVLFFRDGHLQGDGDAWNELDAIRGLHQHFLKKTWVSDESIWTGVEVMKSAGGWRMLKDAKGPKGEDYVDNPIVGECCFPFDDTDIGLVSTTGQPYLSQGTAAPLRFQIHEISGASSRSEVVRDLVWEADMCFTKIDNGLRLPWVLHVADAAALQASKMYQINGITA